MHPRTRANTFCVAMVLSVLCLIPLTALAAAPSRTADVPRAVLVITNDDLPTKLTGVTSPGPLLIDGKPFDWPDRTETATVPAAETASWISADETEYVWPNDSTTMVQAIPRPVVDDGYLPHGLQMVGNVIVPIGPDRFTCPYGVCPDGGSALEIQRMEIEVSCPYGVCPDGRDPLAVPGANRRSGPQPVHNVDAVTGLTFAGRSSRHLGLAPVEVHNAGRPNVPLAITNVPTTIRGRAIKSHAPFNRRGGVGNATTTAIGN